MGAFVLAWLLRIAIYGLVMGCAMLLAAVALLFGVSNGTVIVGWFIAAFIAVLLGDAATRPNALPYSVACGWIKRAAMTARGLAFKCARLALSYRRRWPCCAPP